MHTYIHTFIHTLFRSEWAERRVGYRESSGQIRTQPFERRHPFLPGAAATATPISSGMYVCMYVVYVCMYVSS